MTGTGQVVADVADYCTWTGARYLGGAKATISGLSELPGAGS